MKRIGEILVENGLVSEEKLYEALEIQRNGEKHRRIGEILIDMDVLTYDALLKYLQKQIGDRSE